MENFDRYYIPKSLDDPDILLFFTMGQLVISIALIVIGFLFRVPAQMMVVAVLFLASSREIKNRFGSEQIMVLIYWYLPVWISNLYYLPDSSVRRYHG